MGCLQRTLIAVFVLGFLSALGSLLPDTTGRTPAPGAATDTGAAESEDITGVECATRQSGFMEARISITNHSAKRSNYLVKVVFENPYTGNQIGTASGFVTDLEPGQSTVEEAISFAEPDGAQFSCRVIYLNRTASF